LEKYDIATDHIEVIPNGIHPDRYYRPDIDSTPGRLMTVGRLCKRKGQADVLRGFAKIQHTHPETHLDIVGAGPRRAELEELAAELRVREHVTFHGFVPEEEKIRLLNTADLFVFGSHQEGFGIGILEAMAAGLPIVARNLPVYHDFFDSDVNGVLVTEPFVDNFVDASRALLEEDHRTEIFARNREVAAEYDWDHTVRDMESIISYVTDGSNTANQGSQGHTI
jgi:glycosyltransferase involved in cell wall biosynthesis